VVRSTGEAGLVWREGEVGGGAGGEACEGRGVGEVEDGWLPWAF
jgi:hypothetical protein